MSGRLTPAAATLIRTSPGFGSGTGRSTITSASLPSVGGAITAFIIEGIEPVTAERLIDSGRVRVNVRHVDLEDLFPSKPDDPLVALARQDLDPMSVDELKERIEALKAEIARVENHMQRAQVHRSAAEELFKKQ